MPSDQPLFRPALIVVDFQNDFCAPVWDGSLAVDGGRELAPLINSLVSLPGFVIKIATQDFHVPNHVSFASNHAPPDNKPFESFIDMKNWIPGKENETVRQKLWPVHCVQGTKGAELIDEFLRDQVDLVVQKGMHEKSEMYSVFADAFGNFNCVGTGVTHDAVKLLEERRVSHVFVVGLAGDFCVKCTALDAARAGFSTFVIEEGTKCVDPGQGWQDTVQEFGRAGVRVISGDSPELRKVKGVT